MMRACVAMCALYANATMTLGDDAVKLMLICIDLNNKTSRANLNEIWIDFAAFVCAQARMSLSATWQQQRLSEAQRQSHTARRRTNVTPLAKVPCLREQQQK